MGGRESPSVVWQTEGRREEETRDSVEQEERTSLTSRSSRSSSSRGAPLAAGALFVRARCGSGCGARGASRGEAWPGAVSRVTRFCFLQF